MTPQDQRCAIALRALDSLPTPLLDDVRANVGDVLVWDRALKKGLSGGERKLYGWLTAMTWPGQFAFHHDLADLLELLAAQGDLPGVRLWLEVYTEIRKVSLTEALGWVA